jgi:hypothetical protein
MAVITSGAHPKDLWPGVRKWFGRKYDEHAMECKELFEWTTSSRSYEEDVLLTGFGLIPKKPENGSISFDAEAQGWTKRHTMVAYAMGYIVSHEALSDGLYEQVSKRRSGALAFSARQTKENVAANVYNRVTTAGYTGGDGVVLGSTAHTGLGGNWSNILATAADLSETSLEDLLIQIMKATNDRGLKISLMPKCLLVHPNDWFEAHRILKSVLQNDSANNATNALRATNALPEGIKVNHYFTDTDAWFVRTNCPNGMVAFQREEGSFDQENDFDTKNAKAAFYERYAVGWTDPRGLYSSAGA